MSEADSDFESRYLSGEVLYGDDFGQAEIEGWYEDEREAYARLDDGGDEPRSYGYHNMNVRHAFRHLPAGRIGRALGIGSAYGEEFFPVLDRLDSITIVEPSTVLRSADLAGTPVEYVEPDPSGVLPFSDGAFDLVTCFSVLHHIPNVSFMVSEVARVLRPGGHALVREPIHSMGDWRHPRLGLTTRERGIPRQILCDIAARHFEIVHSALCDFPLHARLRKPDSRSNVLLDEILSRAFAWNYRYHARSRLEKIRPRGLALVLQARY